MDDFLCVMRGCRTAASAFIRVLRESQAEPGSKTNKNVGLQIYKFKFSENWKAELKAFQMIHARLKSFLASGNVGDRQANSVVFTTRRSASSNPG